MYLRNQSLRGCVLWVLLGFVLLATGCGPSKLTKENYDKIKPGMTVQQVEEILGSGSQQGGDGANVGAQFGVDVGASAPPPSTVDYVWEKGPKKITITFKGGKVVGSNYQAK